MSFRVSDALNMSILANARVLAGYSALDNEIKWINILEILDELSHLRSGEFLITTAYGLDVNDASAQLKLLKHLKQVGLSALAIQTGYYIKYIPESLIDYCNQLNLPLIHLPSDLSFGDLTRALLKKLFSDDKESMARAKAASDILYGILAGLPVSQKTLKENFDTLRCPVNALFTAAVFGFDKKGAESSFIRKRLANLIEESLHQKAIPAVVGGYQDLVVVFLPVEGSGQNVTYTKIKRIFDDVLSDVSGPLPGVKILAGIGNVYGGIDTLARSFDDAKKALAASKAGGGFGPVTMYRDLGVFRLLMDVAHRETLISFVNDTLGEMAHPDGTAMLNLLETLRCYLSTKNANKTAQELFIHRHTLKYRLNKIRELTGLDPENGSDQTVLGIAISVLDYLNMQNKTP